MNRLTLGDAVLEWDAARATLERDGSRIEAAVPQGRLADRPLDARGGRAVLASREAAILADGKGFTLVPAPFGAEILAARLVGAAAGLVGRDRVELRALGTGASLAAETPGGASRPALTAAAGEIALAVAFHDRFALLALAGRGASHLVQAGFPLLAGLGDRALAAGRDRIVLADGADPGAAVSLGTRGAIRHDRVARGPDLAGLPSRDRLYVVDALGGRIHEVALDGEILSVKVAKGVVAAKTGDGRTRAFDRDGLERAAPGS